MQLAGRCEAHPTAPRRVKHSFDAYQEPSTGQNRTGTSQLASVRHQQAKGAPRRFAFHTAYRCSQPGIRTAQTSHHVTAAVHWQPTSCKRAKVRTGKLLRQHHTTAEARSDAAMAPRFHSRTGSRRGAEARRGHWRRRPDGPARVPAHVSETRRVRPCVDIKLSRRVSVTAES